ncbi:MAG: hypothetical protein E7355_00770 [Clostridiales bacterium]|nr:hypothetical protein [Clostridiales bacterium]
MSETILKEEERIAYALRSLYRQYGYLPYKMSKFEAYDLYVANKDFLVGDGVITFNDTDGKLLALKPDVTLSIIKNSSDENGKQKVYYHENVYRISGETKQFKEIPQVGLECIGEIGVYEVFETLLLAAKSLEKISPEFVLDVSHLGILSATLEEFACDSAFQREVMPLLAEKNLHEAAALCDKYSVDGQNKEKLLTIIRAYGNINETLSVLAPLCTSERAKESFEELKMLCALLNGSGYGDKIRLDFSVVNDMKYYNGIVFKGFVDGICEGVLSGGQYNKLMTRMHRKSGAIGFAVYLDLLQGFKKQKPAYDVDVLVLYDEQTDMETLSKQVLSITESGKSVNVRKAADKVRYDKLLDLRKGGANV